MLIWNLLNSILNFYALIQSGIVLFLMFNKNNRWIYVFSWEIVIAYKDRLCRSGYELIEDIIKKYSNRKIIIIEDIKK